MIAQANDHLSSGAALQPYPDPVAIASDAPVKLRMGHGSEEARGLVAALRPLPFIRAKIRPASSASRISSSITKATDDFETISKDFYVRAVETLVEAVSKFDKHLDEIERRKAKISQKAKSRNCFWLHGLWRRASTYRPDPDCAPGPRNFPGTCPSFPIHSTTGRVLKSHIVGCTMSSW
jgi:hypothetical protein